MCTPVWPHQSTKFHFWVKNHCGKQQGTVGTGDLGQTCISGALREVAPDGQLPTATSRVGKGRDSFDSGVRWPPRLNLVPGLLAPGSML